MKRRSSQPRFHLIASENTIKVPFSALVDEVLPLEPSHTEHFGGVFVAPSNDTRLITVMAHSCGGIQCESETAPI